MARWRPPCFEAALGAGALLVAAGWSERALAEAAPNPILQRPGYVHVWGVVGAGRALRFNNPFRLATPLGETSRSLSLSATYLDALVVAGFGEPQGWQHGAGLDLSVAVQGIGQETLAPSYVLAHLLGPAWLGWARGGLPIVTRPDPGVGTELGFGLSWRASASFGLSAELVGALFFGAATPERRMTTTPMLGLELGVLLDGEMYP